ncbi:hypothetical protein M2475_001084 [Breznakia sp. PF5-3]|uniref:hypothetical protein n=1 Tax=unclassified Breznakia TaxID=2623764 RepID=UPI0024067AA0|nr:MULTISPECIES: hypothetical protein [unclassified Breznakia]MDF9824294.1 hypothetical protein [Breznakia sp. PM6-1]MDF9835518.1 hypothetical protein [Breznakia sp. PF5-3]MDF9838008.1 hypothetical protein [Breznakia sp. PFB2-8]MDF9859386.1 hypothetical protein [Breznakia sp. PH5-24]
MDELKIKDNDFNQVEDYINQFMNELKEISKLYFDNIHVIYEYGLQDSAMQEVIYDKIYALVYFTSREIQSEVGMEKDYHPLQKAVNEYSFTHNELNAFVSEIDEIDSILY